jgi:hypothetical protein
LHTLSSAFVLGYHGCDRAVADRLLAGEDFRSSDNDYDWLGPGIYFWEANPKRGFDFAEEVTRTKRGPHITEPAVVGAVVDLGLCLDLTTSTGIEQIAIAYEWLKRINDEAGLSLPRNSADLLRRNLDCAVIRLLHRMREDKGLPAVDTVKGVFVEGGPVYPDAGIHEKTHVQICVCNPDCIKGVFRVPERFLL